MIYFLYCRYDDKSQDRIAIHEAEDLDTLLDTAMTLRGANFVHVLGQLPNPGPVSHMDFIELIFEDHIDGLFYMPNSGLLDYILNESTPCNPIGRRVLIDRVEARSREDDMIRFVAKVKDGHVTFYWKRFGDLTKAESADYEACLMAKHERSRHRFGQILREAERRFGKDAVQAALDQLNGPLSDLD